MGSRLIYSCTPKTMPHPPVTGYLDPLYHLSSVGSLRIASHIAPRNPAASAFCCQLLLITAVHSSVESAETTQIRLQRPPMSQELRFLEATSHTYRILISDLLFSYASLTSAVCQLYKALWSDKTFRHNSLR